MLGSRASIARLLAIPAASTQSNDRAAAHVAAFSLRHLRGNFRLCIGDEGAAVPNAMKAENVRTLSKENTRALHRRSP